VSGGPTGLLFYRVVSFFESCSICDYSAVFGDALLFARRELREQ